MGISPSVAAGIYHAGSVYEEVLAVMGDSSFCHSGIQSLMNAVYNRAEMTFIIFDNHITAETGRQPNPATGVTITGEKTVPVSLEKMIAACGVKDFYNADPFDTDGTQEAILEAVKTDGVSVVLLSAACPDKCCTG
jgi:indolepyruvate ferredoxin oxidoreductase alpha subunit